MAQSQFDPAEFARTIGRVAQGQGHGDVNQTPAFDPKLRKEYVEAAIAGRKIEDYRPALENLGFKFIPADRLRRYDNGAKHAEGEWRNENVRLAFTDADILGGFPGGPEEFATWVEELKTKRRLQAMGLFHSKKFPRKRR